MLQDIIVAVHLALSLRSLERIDAVLNLAEEMGQTSDKKLEQLLAEAKDLKASLHAETEIKVKRAAEAKERAEAYSKARAASEALAVRQAIRSR